MNEEKQTEQAPISLAAAAAKPAAAAQPAKQLPTNEPVMKALFNGGDPSRKASQPGMTKAIVTVGQQAMQLVENQAALERQNKGLAGRVDRLEAVLLDYIGPAGREDGVGSTVRKLKLRTDRIESQVTGHLLNSSLSVVYLKEYLPTFYAEHNRMPNAAEADGAMEAIIRRLQAEGDEAAAVSEKLKELAEKSFRCAGCVHWKGGSRLVIVGGDQPQASCEQPMVQLQCPGCAAPQMQPQDPMDVTGKCEACGTDLEREGAERTNCMLFTPDRAKWRETLQSNGIPQDVVDSIAPEPVRVTSDGKPGDVGVAVPR